MSKPNYLEKLMDGAEIGWRPLSDVARIKNGKDHKTLHGGDIPVYGSGGIMRYVDTYAYNKPSVLIPRKGSLGNLFYVDAPFWNVDTIFYTEIDEKQILPKFFYYFLTTVGLDEMNQAGGVPSQTQAVLNKISIPIPCPENPKKSLAIQAEIVRILDAFTALTAELTAELTARKKQYNYYRDKLLTFAENEVEWKPLGDISIKISSGGTPDTKISEYWENGTVPWMSSGEVNLETVYGTEKFITESGLSNSGAKYVPKNSIVIALAGQGKTRGKVARTRIDLTTNQSLAAIAFDESKVNPDYLFYFLKTQYENLRQISSGNGARGGLNLQMISRYNAPIPYPNDPKKSLTEQGRIVAILDKFDALTNSLQEGLPREIELRQKQYEYYRDQLLNFPKPAEEAA